MKASVLKLAFIALVGVSGVYAQSQAQNEKGLRTAAGDFLASGTFSSSDIQDFEYAEDFEEDEIDVELKCKGRRKRPRCKRGWRVKSCTARNAGAKKMEVRLYRCVRKREDVGGAGAYKTVTEGFVPTEMVEVSSSDISEDVSDYSYDEDEEMVATDEADGEEDEIDVELGKKCRGFKRTRRPRCKRGWRVKSCKQMRKKGGSRHWATLYKCVRKREDVGGEDEDGIEIY